MTRPDWDDERLDAAFHARFDRPAPQALEKEIHVRIAGTSPDRFAALRRSGPGWGLAAAAVVVGLVGTLTVGLGGFGRLGGLPAPSDSSATPGAGATPTEQALPGSILGLPIIDVSDAIALRDAGVDDREIAVHGWFTPAPLISCPYTPTVSPLQMQCPDDRTWLTRDAESLIHLGSPQSSFDQPVGPGLNPDLDGLATDWFPELPEPGVGGNSAPVDVVLVGHFDDRRSDLCPRDEIDPCRDRLVVDSVASVHGVPQPVSSLQETPGAVSSGHEVAVVVADEAPDSPILSATVVDGPTGLAAIEPSLGTGQEGLIDQPVLWIVRVLESERAVTYIVIDGSDAIYEMNPEGQAILVGGTPPKPRASAGAGPWPPADARVVALTSEVGAGDPPVRVAVVDKSGRLSNVAEKGDVDAATFSFDGRFGAYAEPGHPGRVHLAWVGGICDSQITVTVEPDLRSISFDMGPQPDCDSIGVGRELVLDFTGSVEVPAIQVGEVTAAPSTSPSDALGYELDCGPLGPDTCETMAADVIAATPSQRVVSLGFSDECGSYTATFDDGNGVSASIDCIRP